MILSFSEEWLLFNVSQKLMATKISSSLEGQSRKKLTGAVGNMVSASGETRQLSVSCFCWEAEGMDMWLYLLKSNRGGWEGGISSYQHAAFSACHTEASPGNSTCFPGA
jgi:hypothetical protein